MNIAENVSPRLNDSINFHLMPNWLDVDVPWNSQSSHPVIHSLLDTWVLGQALVLHTIRTPMLDETLEREEAYFSEMKAWCNAGAETPSTAQVPPGNSTNRSVRDIPIPPTSDPDDPVGLSHSLITVVSQRGGVLISDCFHSIHHQPVIRTIASLLLTFIGTTNNSRFDSPFVKMHMIVLRLKVIVALCMTLAVSSTQATGFVESHFRSWFSSEWDTPNNGDVHKGEAVNVPSSGAEGQQSSSEPNSSIISFEEKKLLVRLFFRFMLYNSGIPEALKCVMSQNVVVPILIWATRQSQPFLPAAELRQYFDELASLTPDPSLRVTSHLLDTPIDSDISNNEVLEYVAVYFEMCLNRRGRVCPSSRVSVTHIRDDEELQVEVLRLLRFLAKLKDGCSPPFPRLIRDENFLPRPTPGPHTQRTELFWQFCTSNSFLVRHWAFYYIATALQSSETLKQLGDSRPPDLYELMNFITVSLQFPEAETRPLGRHTLDVLISSDLYGPSLDLAQDVIQPLYNHVVSIEGAVPFFNVLQAISQLVTAHQDKLYDSYPTIVPLCTVALGRVALSPNSDTRRLVLNLIITLTFWEVFQLLLNSVLYPFCSSAIG